MSWRAIVIVLLALVCRRSLSMAAEGMTIPKPGAVLSTLDASHPRLILKEARLAELKALMAEDAMLKACYQAVRTRADQYCRKPPLTYDKRGPRLLHVSRECVNRMYALGLAWRMTGNEKYVRKARENLLAVSVFKDWNPSHFLDTAEMSHGVGIGYDWFFHEFDERTRHQIKTALIEKGLKPGLAVYKKGGWWVRSAFNWNQVCNGGLMIGALSIAESDPDYARKMIPAALRSMPTAIATYDPDGSWPEGPGYWGYATSYTVFGLAALKTALGTDFCLSKFDGLSRAGRAPVYLSGPTNHYFNYADAGEQARRGNLPCLFWLARRYDEPAFAVAERAMMATRPGRPLDVIWYVPPGEGKAGPLDLDRRFGGPVEIAVFRSAWDDPGALFVAVKAGYNQVNHGHLDLGSFVIDALGVRWARDLGSDDYNLPGYWQKGRGGRRWTYYRLNSLSHNVPLLNNRSQDTHAVSKMLAFKSTPALASTTIDLTTAYKGSAKKVVRGVALLDRRQVLVQDEFELAKPCEIVWGMTTDAVIELHGPGAVMSQDGKQLRAEILSPQGAAFSVESAEQKPPQKRNTGARRLTIRLKDRTGAVRLAVLLSPMRSGAKAPPPPDLRSLDEW